MMLQHRDHTSSKKLVSAFSSDKFQHSAASMADIIHLLYRVRNFSVETITTNLL